jgi:hypothetical protein
MARKNKKGTPFLGLGLTESEEQQLKKHLVKEDVHAKQFLRFLVREFFKPKTK